MLPNKRPKHILNVKGEIISSGEFNVGDGADVKINSHSFKNTKGVVNISSKDKSPDVVKILIGVATSIITGFILWKFGWN